eukprot:3857525-Karenia_brevis.AAC.1
MGSPEQKSSEFTTNHGKSKRLQLFIDIRPYQCEARIWLPFSQLELHHTTCACVKCIEAGHDQHSEFWPHDDNVLNK